MIYDEAGVNSARNCIKKGEFNEMETVFDRQQYIEETAAYIRVSHREQQMHGISLEAQEQKLREFAEKHNLKIVEWYKDAGVSGRKLIKKRPELQRMIHDAQKGRFRRIIFIKLDRYFRSVAEFHECQKLLDDVGVTWTATEEKYDMSTANGRAFVNMKLTIAELEADTGGERVKLVNEYKVKSGLPLFGNQSMPFCFAVGEPEEGERHKYICKRDEEIMEDLIAHVMVNHSVRAALAYVNAKYQRTFRYNSVMKALKNEMICGSYKGNPNYCPPYITREMFEKLQAIIKRNPRTTGSEHTYIFTGLIRCPECGTRLSGTMHVTKKAGKTYRYFSYRCNGNRLHKICPFNKSIFEKRFEQMMLAKIVGFVEDKKARSIEIHSGAKKPHKDKLPELHAELDRLNYSWQKGRIKTVEEYDRRYDEITERITAATEALNSGEKEPDYEKIRETLSGDWRGIYEALDAEHRRAFWRSFVDEIHIEWDKDVKEIKDIIFL